MARWELIAENVKFTRQEPREETFIADTYECTNCHHKVNNREPLPMKCPWCESDMRGDNQNDRR